MSTPVIGNPEPSAVPASPTVQPTQKVAPARGADKRADALRAKKKKRDAHRVTLRRSHTGG